MIVLRSERQGEDEEGDEGEGGEGSDGETHRDRRRFGSNCEEESNREREGGSEACVLTVLLITFAYGFCFFLRECSKRHRLYGLVFANLG